MSERIADEQTWVQDEAPVQDEVQEQDETQVQEPEPLVRRPRRRLLTPLTALLFAVLVGAGGFIAGVQVEKGETSTSSTRGVGRLAGLLGAAGGSAAPSTAPGGRGFAAAGGAGATVGQVEYVSGSDLYVTNLEGNTVKILAGGAQITKQVNSSVKAVHPGDTVIVQGATRSNGSVRAATVRDSGANGAGAGRPSGGASGAGGEPALFGK